METILEKISLKRGVGINISRILSTEEQDKLYSFLYAKHIKGATILDLARKYGVSNNTLTKQFGNRGYKIVNYNNALSVRQDLFNTVETEEDAYWLGFIYADGYISDNGIVEISLKASDVEHLNKFATYIKYTKEVKVKDHRCRLSFATQQLKSNFNNLGVVPRKSLILTFPEFLSKELNRHFIRGYFDGDGCLGLYKSNKSRAIALFSLLGTESFLNSFREEVPIKIPRLIKKNNIHIFQCSNRKARKLAYWLYNDSSIYLDRKFTKAQEIAVLWGNA